MHIPWQACLQASMVHERLLPLAIRCLHLDSARVRQAAAQAIVAIMRQASLPSQQVQICRRLCHISTHASASVSSISFIEGCRCMMHGFTTRYTACLPKLSAVCCLLDSCLLSRSGPATVLKARCVSQTLRCQIVKPASAELQAHSCPVDDTVLDDLQLFERACLGAVPSPVE